MNTNTPNLRRPFFTASDFHKLLIAGACFSFAGIVSAQTSGNTEDNTVRLSVFTVSASKDVGYRAANSVSATRVDTEIKDLPFSISAYTSQFITDTGSKDLFDIVRYAPGVTTAGKEFTGGSAVFTVRGFPQAPEHDGFSEGSAADVYVDPVNIDRVEVVKGPASLLYGAIAPGGTVNYITKRATNDRFVKVTSQAGSYDYKRATIDINEPVIKGKLLFRLNVAAEDEIEYVKPSQGRKIVVAPTATWNISKNLCLTVSDQYFHRRETPPALYQPNMDVSTPASMVTALTASKGYTSPVAALSSAAGPDTGPDPTHPTFKDGGDLGFALPYPALSRTFNWASRNDWRKTDLNTVNVELDSKFGDHWTGRGNFNYNANRDSWLATGSGFVFLAPPGSMTFNGTTWAPSAAWSAMTALQQNAAEQAFAQQILANPASALALQGNQPAINSRRQRLQSNWGHSENAQFDLAGKYDFSWVKLKPLIGAEWDKSYEWLRDNNDAGNAAQPFFPSWDLNSASPTAFVDNTTSFGSASVAPFLTTDSLNFVSDQAIYGVMNASLLHDRLYVVLGVRYNRSQNQSLQSIPSNFQTTGLYNGPGQGLRASDTTPQFGLGYKVLKDMLVYTSYSESYSLPSVSVLRVQNVPVTPAAPVKGEGMEAGVKTDFLDGRISSTVAVYRIEQRDNVQSLNAIVNGSTVTTDTQGVTIESQGVEGEVTLSPLDNWQIYISATEDDVRNSKEPAGNLLYLGAHPQLTAKTLANLWSRYTFTRGPVKGLWIGGGFNYTGKAAADNRNPGLFLPSYWLWNSAVGYDWTWRKIAFSATAQWKNMANKQYIPANQQIDYPERIELEIAAKF
jgi:iron complex outermembrane receptor protein